MMKVGDRFKTNSGWCKVIGYVSSIEVWVRFVDTNFETRCEAGQLRKGLVKDLYYRSICEVGYLGEGSFSNKETPKVYNTWSHMHQRCYDPKEWIKHPTYKDCHVHKSFDCLQDFGYWFEDQYGSDIGDIQLDKDLLLKKNKMYSPRRCVLLPPQVNSLLTKRDADRGECLIGVYKFNRNCKRPYIAKCSTIEGVKSKCFATEIKAYNWYKAIKEQNIKDIADLYKHVLDPRAYKALLNYEVELTD